MFAQDREVSRMIKRASASDRETQSKETIDRIDMIGGDKAT